MNDISQIDYEAVDKASRRMQEMGQILTGVNKALLAAMMLLKTSAFIGLVGGNAVERYIANIQPKVEQLAEKCNEMSADLDATMADIQSRDQGNAPTFSP